MEWLYAPVKGTYESDLVSASSTLPDIDVLCQGEYEDLTKVDAIYGDEPVSLDPGFGGALVADLFCHR